MKNNFTVWITGLSSSGKTTLAICLKKDLLNLGIDNVVLLDGDILRKKLKNFNYDEENRENMGLIKARLAIEENKQGKISIVTGIASKKVWRNKYRSMIKNYYEIYLKCSPEVCAKRDNKNIYKYADNLSKNNFPGITDIYEESESTELIIDTDKSDEETSSKLILKNILDYIKK